MAQTELGNRISGYRGKTYRVPCDRGGWNASPNFDLLPPTAMTEALNINLHRGGRETRGGVDKVNTTAITGSPRIWGITQFRLKNGNTFTVTATGDGKIQKDYATELKTGLTINRGVHMTTFKDVLYICTGNDRPQTWDGVAASTSDLTNIPTDWSGANWPKKMVVHGRGVSERLWAFGVASKLGTLYASKTATDDFSNVNVFTLVIETGDGFGVLELATFGNRLIPIGRRRPYLVDDSDASSANWGYTRGQWDGGIATDRLSVQTPNDLLVMDEVGNLYSVIATQEVGDYRAVSLTRPAFLDAWIRENLDIVNIADWHMVYDSQLRAVKIFVRRKDVTQVDTALVFFIDRPAEEAWTRHTYNHTGGVSASAVERVSSLDRVLCGGYTGTAYRLESSTKTDDTVSYQGRFSTPELTFDNPREQKRYDRGWLVMRPQDAEKVIVTLEVDGLAVVGSFILVDKTGDEVVDKDGNRIGTGIEEIFTVSPTFAARVINESYPVGAVGTRVRSHVRDDVSGQGFFISQLLYDFLPLGSVWA